MKVFGDDNGCNQIDGGSFFFGRMGITTVTPALQALANAYNWGEFTSAGLIHEPEKLGHIV